MRFMHQAPPSRVLFGCGRRHEVVAETRALGSRPLLIATTSAASTAPDVLDALDSVAVGAIHGVRRHVPVGDAEKARARAAETGADCLVAVGGGSAIGLAKAIALTARLPVLAVPTTYSGSEATPVWGMTENGVKTTGRDDAVAPRTVIYDPELTHGLPAATTASSGMNALAHSVDSLWAPGRTPLTALMAQRSIEWLNEGLRRSVADVADTRGRELALAGAWLAGSTFAVTGSSIHHKLCHALGGRFDLPHAETHAAMLPWTADLALRHLPELADPIALALGADTAVDGLLGLAQDLGAPTSLGDLGLTRRDAEALAADLDPGQLATPFVVTSEELRDVLVAAVVG